MVVHCDLGYIAKLKFKYHQLGTADLIVSMVLEICSKSGVGVRKW